MLLQSNENSSLSLFGVLSVHHEALKLGQQLLESLPASRLDSSAAVDVERMQSHRARLCKGLEDLSCDTFYPVKAKQFQIGVALNQAAHALVRDSDAPC